MTHSLRADNFMASLGFPNVYRVGGSVRDELLKRRSKDMDYVVQGASLRDLRRALEEKGQRPGKLKLRDGRHVGWRVAVDGLGLLEIMLPRTERKRASKRGENERHAFDIVVEPGLTLAEDAVRRDFTFNALYRKASTGELLDPLDRGRADLEARLVRTTHPDSFRDDPLRILRALRFRSSLPGFYLSHEARDQMTTHADAVDGLTERGVSGTALDELCKLLMGRHVADALRDGRDTGALAVLLPELASVLGHDAQSQYHDLTTDEHIFKTLERAAAFKCNLRTRMALLFHDSGKPEAGWYSQDGRLRYYAPSDDQWAASRSNDGTREKPQDHADIGARKARQALTRLNAPRRFRDDVVTLCENHMVSVTGRTKPAKVRQWRCTYGDDLLRDLLKLRLCDVMGKADIVDEAAVRAIARLEKIRDEAEHEGVPTAAADLAVGGDDALALGLRGPEIGRVLRAVLHEVVSQPTKLHRSREWQAGRLGDLAAKEIRSR